MNLIIEAPLSAPPSEISCFRDVTLYGKIFIFEDVLLRCEKGSRSFYWEWLKAHGAHDFISQLIREDEDECGFFIGGKKSNLNIPRIDAFNLSFIISAISSVDNR